jgi:MscS family membrane protein
MKRHGSTMGCLLALALLGTARAQAPQADKLHSPRATVQTLFVAVNAARQNPKFIAEGTACLDLGGLPAGTRDPDLLAVELEEVLRAADVCTERLPDDVAGDVYALSGPDGGRIALHRQPDGRWLFDRDTVAQIPPMAAAARKVLQDRNKDAAALNVAPDVASPRAAFRTFLTNYFHGNADRTLRCLNLTEIPAAAREEVGEQLAHKLCQVILKNRSVIYQDLPDSNYSDAYVWLSLPAGSIELVRLPAGDRKGEWVFSSQTVRSIDRLYEEFEDRPYHEMLLSVSTRVLKPDPWRAPELWLRDQLPGWAKANLSPVAAFRLELYQLLGVAVLAVLAFAIHRLSSSALAAVVSRVLALRGWKLPPAQASKYLRPAGWLLASLALREGILVLDVDKTLLGPVLTVLNPLVWATAAWAVFRVIDLVGAVFEVRMGDSKNRAQFTEMVWPVGSVAAKIALSLALVLHLMALFAWDVTAVLTGLGIGGVAFALGAQDSLRNLFGSFTLLADRPFVVGETVQIGEGALGVVERVGLRSTSIRTVDDTLMVAPNSNLTTMNITNFGRRRFRRFTTRIPVAYGTPRPRLAAFRDGVRRMAEELRWTRKGQCEAAIHDLTASAIELQVGVYFDVTTGHEETEAREALLLGCLRVAEELRIDLAVPTHTPTPEGADFPTLPLPKSEAPRAASA